MLSSNCVSSSVRIMLMAALLLASSVTFASKGEDHDLGQLRNTGPGSHSTLPVPAAPIFGAFALAAAGAVAHSRRRSKKVADCASAKNDAGEEQR